MKLPKRLSRIRGQVEATRRAALDGFIAEVVEDHVREHVMDADNRASLNEAAQDLIGIVHSYLI